MALHQIEKITEYVRFLERNPAEVKRSQRIALNVTQIFVILKRSPRWKKKALPGHNGPQGAGCQHSNLGRRLLTAKKLIPW